MYFPAVLSTYNGVTAYICRPFIPSTTFLAFEFLLHTRQQLKGTVCVYTYIHVIYLWHRFIEWTDNASVVGGTCCMRLRGAFVMAALRSRCVYYIFVLFLLLFLAYYQQSQIGCLPYFHTWCGLSTNLGCRSETCCTRLAENTGCKNDAKNQHLGTIALSGYIFVTKAHVDSRKKTC